jgi:hypothetical protein
VLRDVPASTRCDFALGAGPPHRVDSLRTHPASAILGRRTVAIDRICTTSATFGVLPRRTTEQGSVRLANKPDFKDDSWDATAWSLWGLLYTGAKSDRALKTAISQTFGQLRNTLGRLGPQVDPLASKVQEWRDALDGYARTIKYAEANGILLHLQDLLKQATELAESDRLLVQAHKKPPPKVEEALAQPKPPKKPAPVRKPSVDEEDDEFLAFALKNQNSILGHSKATAKSPPKIVKPKQVYVPPTPEQEWKNEQRTMANHCDNGIAFGAHEVNQDSVLRRLQLAKGDSIIEQFREGPANSHLRIMNSQQGEQFWTLGLTHREKRDKGDFSVYRRVGAKSQFVFVSGRRHPRDPGP